MWPNGFQILQVETVATKPIAGQKPGTSGLRKKTKARRSGGLKCFSFKLDFYKQTLKKKRTLFQKRGDKGEKRILSFFLRQNERPRVRGRPPANSDSMEKA